MATEHPRWRELAQAVTDHGLSHPDRDVRPAVMDADRDPHHLRRDHRAPGPSDDLRDLPRLTLASFSRTSRATKGPFFLDRAIYSLLLRILASLALFFRVGTPRASFPTASSTADPPSAALAASVRVIVRAHRHPSHARPPPEVAHPARLAVPHVLVVGIAHPPHGGYARHVEHADLTRGKAEDRPILLAPEELGRCPGRPRHLPREPG